MNPILTHHEKQRRILLVAFFLAHIGLAFLMRADRLFSTMHGLLTLGACLFFLTDKKPTRLIYGMGYIIASEIPWRVTQSQLFWETAKYALIGFSVLGLLKFRSELRIDKRPFLYFFLLIPSVFVLTSFDREQIAFSLAGPLALAAASAFFSTVRLDQAQVRGFLLAIFPPVLSLSTIVVLSIATSDQISFSVASSFITSGNYGPNQVSSILGLAATAAFLFAFLEKRDKFLRNLSLLLALGWMVQSALTFSRGGFWTALIAMASAGYFLVGQKRERQTLFGLIVIVLTLVNFFILPALDQFTGGTLEQRFVDFSPTGRVEIVRSDWDVFLANPLVGVGPYQSRYYHDLYWRESSSHTEYSRMLAEHGLFGVVSLIILINLAVSAILKRNPAMHKAVIAACLVWTLLFLSHSATRLAAPSLIFGIALANFVEDKPEAEITPAIEHKKPRLRRAW